MIGHQTTAMYSVRILRAAEKTGGLVRAIIDPEHNNHVPASMTTLPGRMFSHEVIKAMSAM